MTIIEALELLQLATGVASSVATGKTGADVQLISQLESIALKAARAYQAAVGQPLDLSNLKMEEPIA